MTTKLITIDGSQKNTNIKVPEGTDLEITEELKGDISPINVKISVQPGASATYHAINKNNDVTRTIQVAQDASIHLLEYNINDSAKAFTEITLTESGAHAKISAVFLGSESNEHIINHKVIHDAPHTTSDIKTRGLLLDHAKTKYEGLIRINQNAPHSQGVQKIDTLMVSEDAFIDQTPNLEIHNDNVQCGHGATIGHFDLEHLFYLMSRGMNERSAKQTLAKGFLLSPIQNMCPALVSQTIDQKLTNI
jgi:Fe-S cluster assembly protein SufD